MYPTHHLEWLFEGKWQRIGWVASDPKSVRELREHGQQLIDNKGGQYRLVTPSVWLGQPDVLVHTFSPSPQAQTKRLTHLNAQRADVAWRAVCALVDGDNLDRARHLAAEAMGLHEAAVALLCEMNKEVSA